MTKDEAHEALALIREVVGKIHDDTILQQWGIVMIVTAFLNVVALSLTQYLVSHHIFAAWPHLLIWGAYLILQLLVCLWVKAGMGGTITYVEKHIWGNGITYILASACVIALDLSMLPLPDALRMIPAHQAVISAVSFAIISLINPRFFVNTIVFLLTAAVIGVWPTYGFAILGAVWFVGLLVPGIIFVREHRMSTAQESLTRLS